MHSFILPGTSLTVSKIGLGTANLHHSNRYQRYEILKASIDIGITHFDTARLYGNGICEKTLGNYFSQTTRQSLTIATKVGFDVSNVKQFFPIGAKVYAKVFGLSQQKPNYSIEACERSLNDSLKALKSEWVDILFLHEPLLASRSQIDLLLPWFKLQQSLGKARYIGLAGDNLIGSDIYEQIGTQFDVIQTNFDKGENLLNVNKKSQIQYGFFRDSADNLKYEIWKKIYDQHFNGMVLYSSRSPNRIRDLSSGLSDIEMS